MKETLEELLKQYENYKELGLSINLARGKPCEAQLDLSSGLMDALPSQSSFIDETGFDVRNYGELSGIKEIKRLFASLLGVRESEVFVAGNSSLSIQYKLLAESFIRGVNGQLPFARQEKIKWLCPVPGYDRHFAMLESLGVEMINVEMDENGPDMDKIEEYIQDPSIKGIWCVPIYSNPTGVSYSDEVVMRFARLKPAAKDFRIYWDLAYFAHHLYGKKNDTILNLLNEAKKTGNEDLVYMFFSTSKITFAGSGIALVAASEANTNIIQKLYSYETIGFDKVNQLRHYRFLIDETNIANHMRKHAAIIRPKFEKILSAFQKEIKDIAWFTEPNGGYFISIFVKEGTAKRIVTRCKEAGLTLTDAGCAYPYHNDPYDSHIRLAPTAIEMKDLDNAIGILITSIKIETLLKASESV